MMLLETTLHRIGGEPGFPRHFGPWAHELSTSAIEYRDVSAVDGRFWMRLTFDDWAPVDEEWLSCRIRLEDMSGCAIGTRPALVYCEPYDVPTYATFQPRGPWPIGTFSLGLRMLAAA